MPQLSSEESAKVVAAQVEQARLHGTTSLNLDFIGLQTVPPEVLLLTNLESLSLAGNALRTIPQGIQQLTKLRELDVRGNPIESLPDVPGLLMDWGAYLALR